MSEDNHAVYAMRRSEVSQKTNMPGYLKSHIDCNISWIDCDMYSD